MLLKADSFRLKRKGVYTIHKVRNMQELPLAELLFLVAGGRLENNFQNVFNFSTRNRTVNRFVDAEIEKLSEDSMRFLVNKKKYLRLLSFRRSVRGLLRRVVDKGSLAYKQRQYNKSRKVVVYNLKSFTLNRLFSKFYKVNRPRRSKYLELDPFSYTFFNSPESSASAHLSLYGKS